ncbi:MAG: molybdate transport system permease protein, partial [Limisphaerales bacterium]
MSEADIGAVLLTLKLASVTTAVLLIVSTPLAWWLAFSPSRWKTLVSAVVALPLVLPPTVIGFYLLLVLSPTSFIGQLAESLGIGLLPFTFTGLVIGSCIYSLPFVVQPIQNALLAVGKRPLEVAATLRASPMDRFFTIALPLARPGFLTACVLG